MMPLLTHTEWSRGSSVTHSSYLSGSASSPSFMSSSSVYIPFTNTLQDARILSTITERTENPSSRPTSNNLSALTHSQQFSQHSPQGQQFMPQNPQFQMMPPLTSDHLRPHSAPFTRCRLHPILGTPNHLHKHYSHGQHQHYPPQPEVATGQGACAARISYHLRSTSHARSASPCSLTNSTASLSLTTTHTTCRSHFIPAGYITLIVLFCLAFVMNPHLNPRPYPPRPLGPRPMPPPGSPRPPLPHRVLAPRAR